MKKIIYSGNWGALDLPYYGRYTNWSIYSLYHQKKYSELVGADYRVIDNSNWNMNNWHRLISSINSKMDSSWPIGTFTSVAAIINFLESDYDEMVWFDSDVCINKFIDIFQCTRNSDFNIKYKKLTKDQIPNQESFSDKYNLLKHFDLIKDSEYYYSCNSSLIKFNQNSALKYISHFYKNFNLENVDYLKSIEHLFNLKNKTKFISEEYTFDYFVNKENIDYIGNIGDEIISDYYENKDTNFIHFIGCAGKLEIENFYRNYSKFP